MWIAKNEPAIINKKSCTWDKMLLSAQLQTVCRIEQFYEWDGTRNKEFLWALIF